MIAKNLLGAEVKLILLKNKFSQPLNSNRALAFAALSKVLPQRNYVIDWLYRAQRTLSFSRSSMFLGIALLDKLITFGVPLTDTNF